jgi:hypothetical protein
VLCCSTKLYCLFKYKLSKKRFDQLSCRSYVEHHHRPHPPHHRFIDSVSNWNEIIQGSLTEGEGSVQLTSLYQFRSAAFHIENINIYLYYKTRCLNEEVNCTESSPSVRLPWIITIKRCAKKFQQRNKKKLLGSFLFHQKWRKS